MIELYILLVFMIIAALIAAEVKDLLSSVIAVGAVGLGLSMTFLLLKAPDAAITQLVVEILVLIILIRAVIKRDSMFSMKKKKWSLNAIIAIGFTAVFLFMSYKALKNLPEFGFPIMKVAKTYIDEGLNKTGAANLVTSVMLDFRAYDTLGEAAILFTAVVGVLAIMRKRGRKKHIEAVEGEDD